MRDPSNFSGRGGSHCHLVGGLAPRQPSPRGRLGLSGLAVVAASLALAPGAALAQPPPGTGTDMEIDPDAPPPEPPKKEEPPPLPPPDKDAWGVGGKDEEGRFAPQGKTGSLKEEEEDKKAAEDDKGPVDLGPPGAVTIDMVVGFGEVNELLNDASNPSEATVLSFLFSASYRAFEIWTLGLRLPYATGSFDGEGHDKYNTFALGNLDVYVRPSFQISRRLRVTPGLAFALPIASGDVFANPAEDPGSIAQYLVNEGADAARGLEESSLFASNRFGLVPSVGISYDRGSLHLAAQTKLEMMFRTSGEDPNVDVSETHTGAVFHDPSTNWVTGASGSYDFLDGKVSPGLRTWLAVSTEQASKGTRDFSGVQFALEPGVTGKFAITDGISIRAGLSYIIPLGGPVGGQFFGASMSGLRLMVGGLFGSSGVQPDAKPAPPSLLDAPPGDGSEAAPTEGEGAAPAEGEGTSAPDGPVEEDPKPNR